MTDEPLPIALPDLHSPMRRLHIASGVVERPARGGAEKIDEELFLSSDTVLAPMEPETTKLDIRSQATHQLIRHGGDRVISAKAHVQCFRHFPCSLFSQRSAIG